jgi:multicomponent Na+:H+ antiporter subunit E
MTRIVSRIVWLTIVWLALWEDLGAGTVASGIVVASLLVALFPPEVGHGGGRFRPLAVLRFAVFFLWKLFEASITVAWEVVTPRSRINQGIVAIPVRGVSNQLTTLVANAISLTPGTLTIEVDEHPTVLYVHVLHLRDIEAVRREIQLLEALAIKAFGSPAALAALDRDVSAAEAFAPSQATTDRPSRRDDREA